MWRKKYFATTLLCAVLTAVVASGATYAAAAPGADPSVQDMVDALAKKPASEPGTVRMRSLGAPKPTPSLNPGQLQLSVQFELASATISAGSRALLARLGEAMNSSALSATRFRIEGHTDASGDAKVNLALSERRAQGVRQFLISNNRIDASRLSAVGKGSSEPIDRANPAAAANRRVVIVALDAAAPGTATPPPASDAAATAQKGSTSVAGTVRQLKGEVSATRGSAAVTVAAGSTMNESDAIATAATGSVLIQLEDGAKLLIRPNSRVILSRVTNSGPLAALEHSIDLITGALRYVTGSVGHSRPQGVRFKTPTATIGIRGTDIDIVYAPKMRSLGAQGTYVRVNSGEISLDGSDGSSVRVAKDEQAFAGAPGPLMRGGGREPAARKLAAPATVFASEELDSLLTEK
ncbi:MAG: OmpA family protein [Betaproteobacteria bacterium]|nr:OmpA family protein [Betaproteobacteria bacterium]